MSYPTYLGWTIINPPSSPAPSQIDVDDIDAVSLNQSPYNQATQMQVWLGAEQMQWNVSLPPMKSATARTWTAWLQSLQGIANVFQLGNPNRATPLGSASGTPLVDGTSGGYNLPLSSLLHTKGWTHSATGVLLPGDHIQIGYRLYNVLQQVDADSSGNAIVNVYPVLREQPNDGDTVITSNAKGLWRRLDNKISYTERANKMVGISFKIAEAR